jgi:hypothetical protein
MNERNDDIEEATKTVDLATAANLPGLNALGLAALGAGKSLLITAEIDGDNQAEPTEELLLSIKARIVASRAEHEERLNELGKLTGRWWVTHSAKFDQLERLSESANGYYPEEIDELNELLFPSNHHSPHEVVEFWNRVSRENTVLSADIEDPQFVQGFFEGSLELYEEAMDA